MAIKIELELTDEMLEILTKDLLKKGGKKIIDAVAKIAIDDKKKDIVSINYSMKEVARITNKNIRTIGKHIEKDLLTASRVGGQLLITETNLKKYINGNNQ